MKTYVGKGIAHQEYDLINFSICLSDIPKEDIVLAKNGKKYVNLTIARMKDTDQWGKTHTVYIDNFKPEKKETDNDLSF